MPTVIAQLCIDSHDPLALARWWAAVLGWRVEEDASDEVEPPDEIAIVPSDETGPGGGIGPGGVGLGSILFLRVPDAKGVKNRLHLDLRPTDGSSQEAELDRLLAHGARPVDIGQGDVAWHVLADPEGNEFCLLRSTPRRLAELLTEGA